jgi:hypothetical protein
MYQQYYNRSIELFNGGINSELISIIINILINTYADRLMKFSEYIKFETSL